MIFQMQNLWEKSITMNSLIFVLVKLLLFAPLFNTPQKNMS